MSWLKTERKKIRNLERKIKAIIEARKRRVPGDPAVFCRKWLGFEPTKYQLELIQLFQKKQFVAAWWSRQSGKSHIISALLLWFALRNKDAYIAVVGPSWRQTKLIIRRINNFLRKIPKGFYHRPLRTMVRFSNGSLIEAFPNNPETIRGPTLNLVYCDEMNFIPNDEELYDAILFTLGTTNGKFVCTSTPWTTDSVFYKICHNKEFEDFGRSHITYQEAVEPKGPLKKEIVEKIKKQFEGDPWRWKREMMAEWAEDQNVWLCQSLITKCIASEKTLGHEIQLYPWDTVQQGDFFAGLDLGKHQDHSVLVIIEKVGDKFLLRHLKIWPLETSYASVIGYMKALQDRWNTLHKVQVDMTGVGDYIVEDMENAEIRNVEGTTFTLPRKQEMASLLKQRMIDGRYWFPYFTWRQPYPGEYVTELNVERFELRKEGKITLNHPSGTHDDVFWATALSLYATVEMEPIPKLWVVPR